MPAAPAQNSTGTLDEVLEYDVALTSTQVSAVESYLEDKYFLNIGTNPLQSNILPATSTLNLSAAGGHVGP